MSTEERPILPPKAFSNNFENEKYSGHLMQVLDKSGHNGERQKEEKWCVLSQKLMKLFVFNSKQDLQPLYEVNILKTALFYDPEDEKTLVLKSGSSSVIFEADSIKGCVIWLENLSEVKEIGYSQAGKLKSYDDAFEATIRNPHKWLHNSSSVPRRPKSLEFLDSITQNKLKPSVAVAVSGMKAVTSALAGANRFETTKVSPSDSSNAMARKLRASFKIKNNTDGNQISLGLRKPKNYGFDTKELAKTLETVTDDLNNAKEELKASRQVIGILQHQVQSLTQEKDTLTLLHRLELHDMQIIEILRDKDKSIVNLENQLQCCQLELEKAQSLRDELSERVASLEDNISAYEELVQGKDATILKLSNDLGENSSVLRVEPVSSFISGDASEDLSRRLKAYMKYVKFLETEVMKVNSYLDQSVKKEREMSIKASDWEAKFCQIQSKYLLLLNDLHSPTAEKSDNMTMVSQLLQDLIDNSQQDLNLKSMRETINYDEFGFPKSPINLERLSSSSGKKMELSLHGFQPKWDTVMVNLENCNHTSSDLKIHLRCGVPNEHRGKVWSNLVKSGIRKHQNHLLNLITSGYYNNLLATMKYNDKINPAAKQIELDLLRTLPGNKHYDSSHSDGIPKLRRVLLAFSQHFPDIGYCQGINRIAAISLLFMNEEDAFWCLVYIVQMVLPPFYYSRGLIGAQVDQRVLKDLISEKLPRLSGHIESSGVDLTLFTFNWLLCLFVDSLPVKVYLRVWDSFLYEGSKVLFRYALAIFKYLENEILQLEDHMMIFNFLHTAPKSINDADRLAQIAFEEFLSFPMKHIKHKRDYYSPIVEAEYEEMEANRRAYSKASTSNTNVSLSDED